VKPKYTKEHVERLYLLIDKYLSRDFELICLTDRDESSDLPIQFARVDEYELDTWWNKILIFEKCNHDCTNLYFDLDVNILGKLEFLLDDIDTESVTLVDTLWKPKDMSDRDPRFFCYGNSSVMGWIGKSHAFLAEMLLSDVFKHTSEHYGDDTFINKYGKIRYFSHMIDSASMKQRRVSDLRVLIHYHDPSIGL